MNTTILGLLAETFIHPGSGQNEGAIDLPVARERTTGYPFIAGSSLKGALLDAVCQRRKILPSKLEQIREDPKKAKGNSGEQALLSQFGRQDSAGALLIGDARLLLLPVRSLTSSYLWCTCPLLLERLARDFKRAFGEEVSRAEQPREECYFGPPLAQARARLFLEERSFNHQETLTASGWLETVERLVPHASTRKRLAEQTVLLGNADFAWFARNALPVQARNVLDGETKASNNLWYEESLPPDTLMYSLIQQRDSSGNALTTLIGDFHDYGYLQAGGNETVGQGWFATRWLSAEENNDG